MFKFGPQPYCAELKGVRFGSESVPSSESSGSEDGKALAWARAEQKRCRDEAEELHKAFGPKLGFTGQP